MEKADYKKNIDGLRGISVLAVILFHLEPNFLPGGFIGVDIFFVISGYLISKIILNKLEIGEFNILSFFMSRARRILPMLLFVLIIFSPLIFFLLPSRMISVSESILTSLFFVSNIFFYWESGYFGEAINLKPYIHLWSLSVEEQFYIIFPIYCILFYKKNYFLISLVSLFLISFFLANILGPKFPNANFFLTPTRVWEILTGVFFMLFEKKKINLNSKFSNAICLASLAAIILSFFYTDNLDNIPNFKLLPVIIGTGILIIYGEKNNIIEKLICNRVLIFIGLISYSLYMLHQPILAFNKILNFFDESVITKILFFILLILLSSITWKFIEQPFRNIKKISTKKFLYIIIFIGTTVVILNTIILKTEGLIYKYKEEDKYLALLNQQTQGRYVSKKFNSLSNNKFNKLDKKNIYVIGDSYAQDFINMVYENNYFKGFNVNTASFSIECYLKFLNRQKFNDLSKLDKCKNNIPEDLIYSDSIFFVNVWEEWIIKYLKEITKNPVFSNKKIFIIGTKHFGKIKINKLIKMSEKERKNYKFKMPLSFIEIDRKTKFELSDDVYISTFKSHCDNNFNCSIFTLKNKLISYDGGHLTKFGAKYFGYNLFKNKNLHIYKNLNNN